MPEKPFLDENVEFINHETNDFSKMALKFQIISEVFSIIPLHCDSTNPENSKKPLEKDWTRSCTEKSNFDKTHYIGRNAGVACGPASGVIVVDIDDHQEFAHWCARQELDTNSMETFTVKSGGKSLHLYFKYPEEFNVVYGNKSVKADDKHTIFDIKGMGGQVVAPGSFHPNGKIYKILNNLPIADAPECFLNLVRKNCAQHEKHNSFDVDTNICIDSNTITIDISKLNLPHYLVNNILADHPVGERSEHEMSVICSLVRLGIKDEIITSIFENYPIGEKYREAGEARSKRMHQQLLKAKNLVGQSQISPQEFGVVSFGDIISKAPSLEFVVDKLWAENDTMMLFGTGGTGKSLFALQLAFALAAPPANGFLETFEIPKHRKVLILQSEVSMAGIYDRSQKMFAGLDCPESIKTNINFMSYKNNIMPTGDFNDENFIKNISETIKIGNHDILIIDPLISFHNEGENANTQMRRVLDKIKFLGAETKTSILIIHHSGKGSQGANYSGGRGASSIGDWASSSIELKRKGNSDSNNFELIHRKARDFQEFGILNLERTSNLIFKLQSTQDINVDSKDLAVVRAIKAFSGVAVTQSSLADKILEQLDQSSEKTISKNTAIKWIKIAIDKNIVTLDPKQKLLSISDDV